MDKAEQYRKEINVRCSIDYGKKNTFKKTAYGCHFKRCGK